jgi:GNAT superfamily N-acetyltransferase
MAANATMPALEIRPARPAEAVVVRRTVPALFTAETAPDSVLVASATGDPELVGVCAIAWRSWGRPPGFPLHIHVADRARRRGIGRALVSAAAVLCRDDTERFHSWDAVDEGSEAEAFARAVGFTQLRRTFYFDADLSACSALIEPIHRRLLNYSAIPPNADVVALRDAPAREVARLVSDAFDSPIADVLANISGQAPGGFDLEYSFVLRLDGAVCGALLQRRIGDIPQVEVSVIAPELRLGWAAVVLLREATHRGITTGAQQIRFRCEDGVLDTVNLARRVNARLVRTAVEYSASLSALL